MIMAKKTKMELAKVRIEIRRLISLGLTKPEILQHMEMADSTYRWHLTNIYAEDKKQLQQESSQYLESEILWARERLQRTIHTCEEIANDKTGRHDAKDRLEAERLKVETTIDLIRLLRDGPHFIHNEEGSDNKAERTFIPDKSNTSKPKSIPK